MNKAAIGIVELKACPFCGREAGIGDRSYKTPRKSGVQHGFTANCMNPECLAVVAGIESFDTRSEAIAAWNTRTPDPIIMEMVEALDKQGRALAAWVNILEARCITADDGEPIPTGGHTWGRNPTHAEVQAALEAQNDAATLLAKVRGKCPRPPHTGV